MIEYLRLLRFELRLFLWRFRWVIWFTHIQFVLCMGFLLCFSFSFSCWNSIVLAFVSRLILIPDSHDVDSFDLKQSNLSISYLILPRWHLLCLYIRHCHALLVVTFYPFIPYDCVDAISLRRGVCNNPRFCKC